jgi:hypothetical protein
MTPLTRPYSCSRYCVLCRSYTFSRLNSTLSLCLPRSAKACTVQESFPKLAAIIANERLANNFASTDMPHQSHSRPFTHAIRPIALESNTSATRMKLSISFKHSSHSTTSAPPSEKASSSAASLLLGDYTPSPVIPYESVLPLDPEPARQLQPNSCHRAFVLHSSACYTRFSSSKFSAEGL